MPTKRSDAMLKRANRILAGGPATLSKTASRYPSSAPAFLSHGLGPLVWDLDGNRYVDCVAGLGPIVLGHNHPSVTSAVRDQAARLASSTLSTHLEVEVAEMLADIIPCAEMVRFATNGADVTNAAIKLARRYTGKKHIAFCGYHGSHDSYLSTTQNDGGILPHIKKFNHQTPWRNFEHLRAILDQCGSDFAGLILEVPPESYLTPQSETSDILYQYANLTRNAGGIFIIDEVVTGFRYAIGGAQEYYGIEADLATFSKGIANGMPCAAITGNRELMQLFTGGEVFLSTTFGANPVSLAAARATIESLWHLGSHEALVRHGTGIVYFMNETLRYFQLPATIRGNFARFVVDWQDSGTATRQQLRTLWLQELSARGVLAGVPWFPMATYAQDTADTIAMAVEESCEAIQSVVRGDVPIDALLNGPVIEDAFQRYVPQDLPGDNK